MTKAILSSLLTVWLLLVGSQTVYAWETVHQSPENFLAEFLPGCEKKALWLDAEVKARVEELLKQLDSVTNLSAWTEPEQLH